MQIKGWRPRLCRAIKNLPKTNTIKTVLMQVCLTDVVASAFFLFKVRRFRIYDFPHNLV